MLALWYLAYVAEAVSRLILPSPLQVLQAFGAWAQKGLWIDIGYTVYRLISSIAFGIAAGLIVGVLIAAIPLLRDAIIPIIESLRSIPAIALFPLFTAAFGIGELARIASVTFSVLFLVALHTLQGISTINKSLLLLPRTIIVKDSMRVRWWRLRQIYLPGALPTILFGVRVALPVALVVIVATEMLFGTSHGLGSRIITSQLAYRIPPAWAAIIVTGLLGYALNVIIGIVEKGYSSWVGR